MAGLGIAAPIIYVGLYILGTIVLAPSPLMSIAAGVAFGWWGLPLAVVAATAGATASFLLSRYFFDGAIEDWLTDRPSSTPPSAPSTRRAGASCCCCGSAPWCRSAC